MYSTSFAEMTRHSGSGTGWLESDIHDKWLFRGDIRVTRIEGAKRSDPSGTEQWAQGLQAPASDDDIMGGKSERQPFRRSVSMALSVQVGVK